MAASQRRMNGTWGRLALTLGFCMLIFHNGVLSQDDGEAVADEALDDPVIITGSPQVVEVAARGDGEPTDTDSTNVAPAEDPEDIQTTPDSTGTAQDTTDAGVATGQDVIDPTLKEDESVQTEEAATIVPQISVEFFTIFGPDDLPTALVPLDFETKIITDGGTVVIPKGFTLQGDIQCVDKDAVKDRDAVKLELLTKSSCEETKARIEDLLGDICGQDCELEIFQEESSPHIIISGQNIEADAKAMADKFGSEGIKEKLGVVEAAPRWGKHPPTVLVSLLLTGLLLAALLIGGYYLRNHRGQQTKGIRLAEESFQVDEENQGNTLVSVAPLHPQEPQEKPSANGESPEGVKTEAPPTNGHSTTKTPVADTEL
ncbi:hypothetical protein AAFF_G00243260 [Aldrovandia affinis]|uniref:Uncharacterized protein n=1 Tax=Aldrovandia affinis TaxID=143900 RepID=A0AAD7W3T8_9TELE|nr:hypothetical protein AAFF_G00243260 [Aldrovandia affinis]